MKTTLYFAAALCIATTGCQSTALTQAQPAFDAGYSTGYDTAAMARIESAARISGVTVVWINPPQGRRIEVARN